jgi:hypothetical protein
MSPATTWGRWITHYDSIVQAPGMHARRRSIEDSLDMHVESIDIAMLNII